MVRLLDSNQEEGGIGGAVRRAETLRRKERKSSATWRLCVRMLAQSADTGGRVSTARRRGWVRLREAVDRHGSSGLRRIRREGGRDEWGIATQSVNSANPALPCPGTRISRKGAKTQRKNLATWRLCVKALAPRGRGFSVQLLGSLAKAQRRKGKNPLRLGPDGRRWPLPRE
jgi:hypothetical protein